MSISAETATPVATPPTFLNPNNVPASEGLPVGLKILLIVIGVIIATFVVLHLSGGGFRHGH